MKKLINYNIFVLYFMVKSTPLLRKRIVKKRTLKFTSWNFRKMSVQELRDANLNEILNNESLNVISSPISRKFDYLENQEQALFENLCLSVLDKNRHKLSEY